MISGTEPARKRRDAERLATIKREAEALARQAAIDLRAVYAELGGVVAQALEAAAAIDERIAEANRHLREGGATDLVPTVADRVAIKTGRGLTIDLFAATSLAPVAGRGWGEARLQAERAGIDVTK